MDPWHFLKTLQIPVYCINLEHRKDRYKQSLAEFEYVGLKPKYLHPTKDSRGGRVGCWLSHKQIIHAARGPVLILRRCYIQPRLAQAALCD